MRLPFVSHRRHDAELDALRVEVEQLHHQRDKALKSASTWHATASRTSELFTDTNIVNDCLTRDLSNLQRRHDRAVRAAARYLAALWQAQARLAEPSDRKAVGEWMALYRAEKKRADRLQKQYDDAAGLTALRGDVGLNDSEHWKPPYSLDAKGAAS